MKKHQLIAMLIAVMAMSGCHDNYPQQQYQQQAPVVVQQPAPAVIVQQQPQHSDAGALLAGAAIGAVAATALNNNDRDRYYQAPVQQPTQITKVVNKTVIVNNHAAPAPAAVAPIAPVVAAPLPVVPEPAVVTKAPSYAAAGTTNPVPVIKSMPAPVAAPTVSLAKPSVPALTYNAPKALPAPVSLSKPTQSYAVAARPSYSVSAKPSYSAPSRTSVSSVSYRSK
jgi:hypothetical protein